MPWRGLVRGRHAGFAHADAGDLAALEHVADVLGDVGIAPWAVGAVADLAAPGLAEGGLEVGSRSADAGDAELGQAEVRWRRVAALGWLARFHRDHHHELEAPEGVGDEPHGAGLGA